jgi:hypothetical protein
MLPACATLSFAPPIVDMKDKLEAHRNQTTFDAVCTPQYATDANGDAVAIQQNVDGALALIDNYILTYRCQRDRAAEGRQYFEVPSFLALAGGATAAAFGAPAGVAIATGAGSAALGSGKNYYAPKDKAKVLGDGIKAMLCIHNEAVGIDGPTIEAISQVQKNSGGSSGTGGGNGNTQNNNSKNADLLFAEQGGGTSVPITADRQYFNIVSTALWSVEQVMSDRLSNSGKEFDMSGVQAELDKLKQDAKDKEAKAGTPEQAAKPVTDAPAPPQAVIPTATDAQGNPIPDTTSPEGQKSANFRAARLKVNLIGAQQVGQTLIDLKSLKPKLDQCVVQAKVS